MPAAIRILAGRPTDGFPTDALHAYATCLMKLKRIDDAAATALQQAVALHPEDPQGTSGAGIGPIDGSQAQRRACDAAATPG